MVLLYYFSGRISVMSKKRKLNKDSNMNDRQLYCQCQQRTDESQFTISCDLCDQWYHPSCDDLDDEEAKQLSIWT